MAEPAGIQTAPPSLRKRRLLISTNLLIQIIVATALVAMVNWLVWRHYVRWDWTASSYYALSEKTKQVLEQLPQPIRVVVFIPENAEDENINKVLADARNLLKEFHLFARENLNVEYVDPQRDLNRAKQLIEQYNLDPESPNVVIFAAGERHKYVRFDELVELDPGQYGSNVRVKAFKGEGVFLSAIQTVTEEVPPKVCFLTGHGERDPGSFDQRHGYSTLATYIKRDNITVEKWNLQANQELPKDAAALVIAGPTTAYTRPELEALRKYLRNQGRLLVLLDPRTQSGLEALLKEWGVEADDNLVIAKGGTLFGTELMVVDAMGVEYAPHPITAKLAGVNTTFPYARSVRRAERPPETGPDAPRVTELVATSKKFWGETNTESERTSFDPASDRPGPLSLAVAVETSKPPGVDLEVGPTRLVVIGTSACADNGSLTAGNMDFFMNALNWLLQREQLLAIAPKTPEEFSLEMSPTQTRTVVLLTKWGLPLAVAVVGITVWVRRRK